jgi:hypothetical protein
LLFPLIDPKNIKIDVLLLEDYPKVKIFDPVYKKNRDEMKMQVFNVTIFDVRE